MSNLTLSAAPPPLRDSRAASSRLPLMLACAALCGGAAAPEARAAAPNAAGYTPTLYVYQNNQLIDVKTFKIAELGECQRRASALLQLYLNHSDIEDDMRLAVRCVPVPPPSTGHRKGEPTPDGEHHPQLAELPEVTL